MTCGPIRHATTNTNLAGPLRVLGAMIVVVLMIFTVSMPLANAQGGDPPIYRLTWLRNNSGDSFRPKDINEAGVVVGYRYAVQNAFMYHNATGMQNLNDLAAEWFDLDDSGNLTTDWIATTAYGINESGQIVGTASHNGAEAIRVFVLNDPLGPAPEFSLLPRFGDSGNFGAAINDLGVVVGGTDGQTLVFDPRRQPVAYLPVGIPTPVDFSGMQDPQEINILGDIVARVSLPTIEGYVISPAGNHADGSFNYEEASVVYYPGDRFYGINDLGMICGVREPITSGKPSQRQDGGAFRFQYPGVPDDQDLLKIDNGNADAHFCDVNEFGDVAFTYNNRGFIYLEGNPDPFALDQLVVFDSPEDESEWMANSRAQSNGINDNGQIIIRGDSGNGFLLTPIVPSPGISVSPTSGLTTTESGGQATFTVKLDTQPTDPVTIEISSDDPNEGMIDDPILGLVEVTSLTFTTTDPQTVTVTGQDDPTGDPPTQTDDVFNITLTASSVDPDYNPPLVQSVVVQVTNLDNDAPSGGGSYDFPDPLEQGQFPLTIPDRGMVSSTIEVSDNFVIASMTVALDIDHPRPSDLRLKLIGPDGVTEVQLSNFTGDNPVSAFDTTNTPGTWTLEVRDVKKRKIGDLNDWSITVQTQ